MSDLLVAAAMSEAVENISTVRPLGSRGSRNEVADSGASELTPTAAAVLAAIPAWWKARASAVGLDGRWLDVEDALQATHQLRCQ